VDIGLIVDVETTGLDSNKDKIIEVGAIQFGWQQDEPPTILAMYGGLQDPQEALTPEISKLTGLRDFALRGQKINWEILQTMWAQSSLIVAHNAQFDRSFLHQRPELAELRKHWACSVRHIDWDSKGYSSRKLQYLAADHGFINSFAHRAMFDCATTFRLVSPHLAELVKSSYEPEIKIIAVASPFESKDILKERKYRWDTEIRAWHKTVSESTASAERDFLSTHVYKGKSKH
jgi:DNA polymerase-3 subunit epsilon